MSFAVSELPLLIPSKKRAPQSDTFLGGGMVSGFLRPISKDYLQNLLEIILNLLVSLGLRYDNVPLDDIVSSLADEHQVPRTVTLQLLAWFGELDESGGKWKMSTESILKEVGIGLLRHHRVCWFYVHFTFH